MLFPLQLAARGQLVEYEITSEDGPPHERSFAVTASVAGEVVGRGVGRTKKAAEQEAALEALVELGFAERIGLTEVRIILAA